MNMLGSLMLGIAPLAAGRVEALSLNSRLLTPPCWSLSR